MTKVNKDRLIVECTCDNPDHLLVIDYYKDEDEGNWNGNAFWDEISISFTSKYYESFWKRVKVGLNYIFKGATYTTGDVVCFNHKNLTELEDMCLFLRERVTEELKKNPRG